MVCKALLALTERPGPEDWTLEHHRGQRTPRTGHWQVVDPSVGCEARHLTGGSDPDSGPDEVFFHAASSPAKRVGLSK